MILERNIMGDKKEYKKSINTLLKENVSFASIVSHKDIDIVEKAI